MKTALAVGPGGPRSTSAISVGKVRKQRARGVGPLRGAACLVETILIRHRTHFTYVYSIFGSRILLLLLIRFYKFSATIYNGHEIFFYVQAQYRFYEPFTPLTVPL